MDPQEQIRINHITFTMDEIHNLLNDLYEAWVDREKSQVKLITGQITKAMKDISDSITGL